MVIRGDTAGNAKEFEDVIKLAVEVATDRDGGGYRLDVRF